MEIKNNFLGTVKPKMSDGLVCMSAATMSPSILDTSGRDCLTTEWSAKEVTKSSGNNGLSGFTEESLEEISFDRSTASRKVVDEEEKGSMSLESKIVESPGLVKPALTPPYSSDASPLNYSDPSKTLENEKKILCVESSSGLQEGEEVVLSKNMDEEGLSMVELPAKRIHSEEILLQGESDQMMTKEQYKYALSMLRQLRKNRDARPFNQPVDPVKLNIPTYPTIITHPMDFGTIDKRLASKLYQTVNEFMDDVKLVFTNCYTFNGHESAISMMAKNLEMIFNKQILQMPSADYIPAPKPSKVRKKSLSDMTGLTANAGVHRSSAIMSRPRREIHPPPSRDLPYNETKPHRRKNAVQLQFCRNVIKELQKKTHASYAFPFYHPVDPVALNIPDYYKIVKHPMDMSTIQGKLNNVYNTADEFESDIRQMFRNCYKFNPVGTPVYNMGKRLEAVFDKKWQEKPVDHHTYSSDESNTGSEDGDENEGIALLEKQLAMMSDQLNAMRNKRANLKTKNKSGKSKKGSSKKSGYRSEERLRILSFDQRSELAQKINLLTGSRLDTVLRIMKESMPELEDQTDEIELDIDSMTPRTQSRLWNYVILNQLPNMPIGPAKAKPIAPKKSRTVLSEAEQLRQIRQLERQLSRFENKGNGNKYASSNSVSDDSSSDTESSSADD